MAGDWFVQIKGKDIGPLSDDQLREMVNARQVKPESFLRKAPSNNWVPASRVRGLFPGESVAKAIVTVEVANAPMDQLPSSQPISQSLPGSIYFRPSNLSGNGVQRAKESNRLWWSVIAGCISIGAIAAIVATRRVNTNANAPAPGVSPGASQTTESTTVASKPTTSAPVASKPVTAAPIVSKPAMAALRPRFKDAVETVLLETRALANLPSTGASYSDLEKQLSKVQQAIARMPDPQGAQESTLAREVMQLTNLTTLFKLSAQISVKAYDLGDDYIAKTQKELDDSASKLKRAVQNLEAQLELLSKQK